MNIQDNDSHDEPYQDSPAYREEEEDIAIPEATLKFRSDDPEIIAFLEAKGVTLDAAQKCFLDYLDQRVWLCHLTKKKTVLAITAEGVKLARQWLFDHGAGRSVKRSKHADTFLAFAKGMKGFE